MVDCKKALEESSGNIESAIEILRKKGIAKAAKRTDRETGEGVVKVGVNSDNTKGYIIELNAETDFVVRSERFQEFSDRILELAIERDIKTIEDLLAAPFDGATVKEGLDSLSGVIGEKLEIKRIAALSGATVAGYSHMGGRIGALAVLDQSGRSDLARDIAMQIAAANPRYLAPENVPAEEIEKEKSIYAEQLKAEGKNDDLIAKIMGGKVNKFYEEICLLKQEYIKDDKKKVENILEDAKVLEFARYAL